MTYQHGRGSSSAPLMMWNVFFFSMLRDHIGKHFTVKQVQLEFRKMSMEFMKRMDPDLQFFYFTSAHDRFYEGTLPDFDQDQERRNRHTTHDIYELLVVTI